VWTGTFTGDRSIQGHQKMQVVTVRRRSDSAARSFIPLIYRVSATHQTQAAPN
jgi:hypothetical protein